MIYENKAKANDYQEEIPEYWMSYSDMMSALLLMFILILTISLFHYEGLNEDLRAQAQKVDSIIGIRKQIIDDLKNQFRDSDLQVDIDPQTGAIRFSEGVFFETNKYQIKLSGKEYLKKFIPQYISVLLSEKNKECISQIIIEGHTDPSGSYMHNLELSQRRAFEVTKYILSDEFTEINEEGKMELRKILTANGRSFSQTIKNEKNEVDYGRSRRVEFKFRLKDEEMIHEMEKILKGE
jgi:outer membrane protein OmpA-like peptidoglycan-associated protein